MRRAGFTSYELLVILVLVIVLAVVAAVIAQSSKIHYTRTLRDYTQLRGIQQALITWASNNDDKYPLPSKIDADNFTVPEFGRAKDTTANIMSILIQDGFITPELLISAAENNKNISAYEGYEIDEPRLAVDRKRALWDPGLSADFTSGTGGHVSFAHLIPQGRRLDMWGSTFKAEEAILSNRGPEMRAVEYVNGEAVTHFANLGTNTTWFYSSRKLKPPAWSGSVAFNDNHVELTTSPYLYAHNKPVGQPDFNPRLKLSQPDGTTLDIHDVLFADERPPEDDDAQREAYDANQYLGIFTTAGESREDFTAIWD